MENVTQIEPASVPAVSLEQRLLEIWKETLNVEQIGPDDNFFELGGDSIMMMMVLSRVREEFGAEPSPTSVFQAPTLRQLNEVIQNAIDNPTAAAELQGEVA